MSVSALRWGTRHRQGLDVLLTLALLVPAVTLTARADARSSAHLPAHLLLSAAVIAPLAWRRRAPVTVWAACTAALAAGASLGLVSLIVAAAPLIALYTLAVHRERRVSLTAATVTLGGLVIGVAAGGLRFVGFVGASTAHVRVTTTQTPAVLGWGSLALPAIVIAACWLAGDNVRVSRAYLAELQAHAAHAQASRATELARATAAERTRIARELHDAVVHNVSVIAVQAGAARMLTGNDTPPPDTAQMWLAVETAARQALSELRQILGLLRHDGQPPQRTPPPSLRQLSQLVDQARRSGLPVRERIEGRPVPLASAADLSAYRIVQEALTNVLKHQGRAATTVSLRYQPRQLEIEVLSQPAPGPPGPPALPPAPPAGHCHGLIGMRERTAMLGGHLHAGPHPGGGFAVVAQIPLESAAS